MLKQIAKNLRLFYDLAIHGYDTTRNIFVGVDGRIQYVDKQFVEEMRQTPEEDLMPFPEEFAKAMAAIHSDKPLPRLEFPGLRLKKRLEERT